MLKIAIVTVTYNAQSGINRTIESVLQQEYSEIEYWIIDGVSSDNTISVANTYTNQFAEKGIEYHIVSKRDKGIFDAMNSSIPYLSSHYVIFLNAGDFFVSGNTLSEVFNSIKNDSNDIIYGDYYAYSPGFRKKYKAKKAESLRSQMMCTHQSIFTKVNLLKERAYDIEYKMTADYEFYLDMFLKSKTFKYVDTPIVYFDISGLSQKYALLTQNERIKLQAYHDCISEFETKQKKIKIFISYMRKKIIKLLPKWIRFYSYERIPF